MPLLAISQRDREIIRDIDSLNSSALIYYNNNQIAESFNRFSRSKVLSDSIQDTNGSAIANYNLGNIYNLMGNQESAEDCYHIALGVSKNVKDKLLVLNTYLSLGELYKNKSVFKKAISYLEEGLKFNKEDNHQTHSTKDEKEIQSILLNIKINLAEVLLNSNDPDRAFITLLAVESEFDKGYVNNYIEGFFNYVYGLYLVNKNFQNNAILKFQKAITLLEKNNQKGDLLLGETYKQLSNIHFQFGNVDEAYTNLLAHNNYKNKYINREKLNQDVIAKSKFLIADYKFSAEFANYKRLQQIEMTNKTKRINVVVMITLFLLFVYLITLYVGYTSKRKLSNTLKARNKELEITKNKALKASELKSKFISSVSHELRTPLYGVVGLASLLLEDKKNFNAKEVKYLNSLKYSGDYLLNLVNDILQVNKMEAQKIALKNVLVNLKPLTEHIVDSFEYRLQETNNKIDVILDDNIPENIKCDKVRLSQVLINLIGNSIKFTESGIIKLRVKLLSLDTNKVGLRFEIEDNGIGIPKDKFKTIFDNFSQLGNENNTKYQGTGLGLSITKSIIELFKSEIELESEVEVGTKISFNVIFEIDKSEKHVLSVNDNRAPLSLKGGKQRRVLIAEDNKINQIVTKNLLIKQDYFCEIVDNGLEAVNRLKADDFDLVLMDINMPVMNGNEATKTIREFNKIVPIIALTAADIEEFKHDYKEVGYNDIITKPFDNHEFFQVIETQIQIAKENKMELVIAS